MTPYLEEKEQLIKQMGSRETGLTNEEAARRSQEDGKNKLIEGKKDSFIKRLWKQVSDPMILVLLAAALVSGITAAYAHESFADVLIILFVVIVNAVLGMYQESKAEKAIEALKEMAAATSKVIRGGSLMQVKSEDLVVGDIVVLEAGDAVPADGRVLESASMQIEEAALTGESVPVTKTEAALDLGDQKDIPLGDRKNMVYMGSTVVYGRGRAIVTGIGMNTEMGKIADALSQAEDNTTPLQKRLNQLSKVLSFLVIGICVFMFIFSLLRAGEVTGPVVLDTFMIAVSLAVAAIPEGLAAVVTVQLAIGVTKMAKRNAVIRKLTAVETLGCTQVICSDKTGTLTQNKMTVVDHFGEREEVLASAMALCSDAEVEADGSVVGEPTEAALVQYAEKFRSKAILKKEFPRVGTVLCSAASMQSVRQAGQACSTLASWKAPLSLSRPPEIPESDWQRQQR